MKMGPFLKDFGKRRLWFFWLWLLIETIQGTIFRLYGIDPEPFLYTLILSGAACVMYFTVTFFVDLRRARERSEALTRFAETGAALPAPANLSESDYQTLVGLLAGRVDKLRVEMADFTEETTDYYTNWVHQIKTPIAVMRLMLGDLDEESRLRFSSELFRIEQYVEMALDYVRLGSDTNDLVIAEYSLDELLRASIRKYASSFVTGKVKLVYEGTDRTVVTDRKWFSVIVEQLISNAVKYSPGGTVTVDVGETELRVADTGIGIAPEDLPLIFQKGYTGANGRLDHRSTGLGLYLSKKAADLLALPLRVESKVGSGSTFYVEIGAKGEKKE